MNWAHLFAVGAVAAVVGMVATWGVRQFALARGMVNHPNPLVPQHRRPVAYLGGVAVFIAAAVAIAIAALARHLEWLPAREIATVRWAFPAALFLALGVVDDLHVLRARSKFAAQVIIALLATLMGARYPFTGLLAIDLIISALVILTLVNAYNLTDVCDGLVAALSIVFFAMVLLICHDGHSWFAASMVGACAGFLVFNRPPASIFLGDAGSHLLGFLTAATLLSLPRTEAGTATDLLRMVLLAAVPLFELAFLIVVRTRKGLACWRGSPDHFALRLQAAGLSRLQTDAVACCAALVLAALSIVLPSASLATELIALAAIALAVFFAWNALLRWEVPPKATA